MAGGQGGGVQLPPLRLVLRPFLGFGTDVRVRFGGGMTAVMTAEASLAGASRVAFGVEPRRAPWLRLQLAPTLQLSVRVPLARLSRCKYIYGGSVAALGHATAPAPLDTSSRSALLSSAAALLLPSLELQHRAGLYEVLFDDRQRRALRAAVAEAASARAADAARADAARREGLRTFDPPSLPPLDPRAAAAPLRRVRERRELSAAARELARRNRIQIQREPAPPPAPAPTSAPGPGFIAPPRRILLGAVGTSPAAPAHRRPRRTH
jgi:hypothetical protein